MAKTPTRRLKVFQAPFGFYDTIVAVPSRAAALRAWETRQDLFAFGQAREIADPAAVAAALAQPGVVLKRAVGSNEPFAIKATNLPQIPDIPKRSTGKAPTNTAPKAAPPEKPKAPPANRSALTRAEAALGKIDTARKVEEAALRRRQDELDAARSAAQAAYVRKRKAATAKVVEARTAYRRAGGTD